MVDVGDKADTMREAVAAAEVVMQPETLALVREQRTAGSERREQSALKKGDVLTVAQLAGIIAAKQTPQLIPLCHPIPITGADLDFDFDEANSRLLIRATVRTVGKTGVEMEALMAATVAGLAVYDMCKAVDKGMRLERVRLLRKSGGRSGTYEAE